MSQSFVPVQWNKQKKIYDILILGLIAFFLVSFIFTGTAAKAADPMILLIRGLGSCAIIMLHIILAIGPLARISDRFKPLLYNRRHFGVMTAIIGLAHAIMALMWYHSFGTLNPIVSAIGGYGDYGRAVDFPFEALGLLALLILLMMAATSHDFWLSYLSPPVWKAIHMSVYVAYTLLIAHVAFGTAQFDESKGLLFGLSFGAAALVVLHIMAALKRPIGEITPDKTQGWVKIGRSEDIPLDKALTISPERGERIAVFRHKLGISAIEAVCPHQNGPLNEGCIVNGLVTCPWHGFQFDPITGKSPPPFEDKVKTFPVKKINGVIWVDINGSRDDSSAEFKEAEDE